MGKKGSVSIKSAMAVSFVLFLFVGFIMNGGYGETGRVLSCLKDIKSKDDAASLGTIEQEFVSTMWKKKDFINLNGLLARVMHMQGFYSDINMYVTDENYIVGTTAYTSTDYEYEQTVALKDFLDSHGIKLLYVNEMTKYTDDSLFNREFGVESFSNRNMDRFLDRIRSAGVNTIDLRDNVREEGIDISDLFYRTDHHWTVPAGLWATGITAKALNELCGYNIDLSIYNKNNYSFKKWKGCWLGEQGRKVAETYVGLDDYTEVKPDFHTDFTFENSDGSTSSGTFDRFVNEKMYNTEKDVYKNPSWHYSYNCINCINNNVPDGKLLIVGDSFAREAHPFLALGVHEVNSIILRNYKDSFSLQDYILKNGYDTVVIEYSQHMLGAHDDKKNANYRMYRFD